MSVLHLVSGNLLGACRMRMGESDAVLLLGDGVLHIARGECDSGVHALFSDIDAYDLMKNALAAGVRVVDYDGFVHLVEAHRVVHHWR